MILRYADFVLQQDQIKGVALFIDCQKLSESEKMDEEKTSDFLSSYPHAHLMYLEHVVLNLKSQVEKFHVNLASRYLDELLKDVNPLMRSKFNALIVDSNLINVDFLLSRLEKTDLEHEKAILYGKVFSIRPPSISFHLL